MSLADAYCNVFDGAEKEAEKIKKKLLQKEREVQKLAEATLEKGAITKVKPIRKLRGNRQFRNQIQHIYRNLCEAKLEAERAEAEEGRLRNLLLAKFVEWRAQAHPTRHPKHGYHGLHGDLQEFLNFIGVFDQPARRGLIWSLVTRYDKLEEKKSG